ncbi:MAG: SUMF1/EgtB/PvdO family nonheme iron enzyme [Bacteroidales bacterium]|nr:SUMF1/EgtB/PvdO family nonheme iron enzyme [Bacteroidales bacterium]
MKKLFFGAVVVAIGTLTLTSCKNSGNGQLVGAQNRPTFNEEMPYGMVFIEQGHYLMGSGEQDVTYSLLHKPKNVTVGSFYMDETEITNNEYRQFVEWVRDSITHVMLGEAELDDEASHFLVYGKGHEQEGEPVEPRLINWKTKIDWNSTNEDYKAVLDNIYISPMGNERYYYYSPKDLNVKLFFFEYWWTDYRNYKDDDITNPIQGAAFKEFDNIDEQTDDGGMFNNRPTAFSQGRKTFIRHEAINIYPDTLCWSHDFTYSFNEPMLKSYFWHPRYDDYPVVGVSWKQAKAFCAWRTQLRNAYLSGQKNWATENDFRLPNETEWEYASRGDMDAQDYPWGGYYTENVVGCYLANFKPQRGNYTADGGMYPIIVGHYHPNDYGLYDMAGNVSEWCEDAFSESAYSFAHDLNMQYKYDAKKSDPEVLKRKVVRGGSWKDVSYYLRNATRSYEYQDTGKAYVGFRCVQSYLGRSQGDNAKTSSNVY